MVQNLMQVDKLEWDADLIRDLFNPRDASMILSIPLSLQRVEDSWYLFHYKKKVY